MFINLYLINKLYKSIYIILKGSILDIILMRAINVKNSERRESIQLLKFLVNTIV